MPVGDRARDQQPNELSVGEMYEFCKTQFQTGRIRGETHVSSLLLAVPGRTSPGRRQPIDRSREARRLVAIVRRQLARWLEDQQRAPESTTRGRERHQPAQVWRLHDDS